MSKPTIISDPAVVVGADVAGPLARLLGDWSREYVRLGLPLERFDDVQQTIAALHETAGRVIAASGKTANERQRPQASSSSTMPNRLTSAQVANATGYRARHVRGLAEGGLIAGQKIGGRWTFDPTVIDQLRRRKG